MQARSQEPEVFSDDQPQLPARRRLLQSALLAGGAWLLGAPPAAAASSAAPAAAGFSPWLRFDAQGLTLLSNISEIGQGSHTALIQIAAEELGLPPAAIRVEMAPLRPEFLNPLADSYVTYGSLGFRSAYTVLAPVCAAARDMLQRAAAARWGVAPADCEPRDGSLWHPPSGRRLALAELLAEAAALSPPERPQPRPRSEWRVLGRALPRADIPAKTDGSMVYGIDVRPPGLLLHAAVLHGPGFGARLLALDGEALALARPGVRRVLRLPGAVAVVADSYWAAERACEALRPRWAPGPRAPLDSEAYARELREAAQAGMGRAYPRRIAPARLDDEACEAGLRAAEAAGRPPLDQLFEFPFLAHAPMEPLNATARVDVEGAELWVSTQNQSDTQAAVAKALGLPVERVRLHSLPAGGGFGRRLEHDFVREAALIARAFGAGRPVKTIWSRATELAAGHYRPAWAARVRLALGADGLPQALRVDMAGARIESSSGVASSIAADIPDGSGSMGWLGPSYALPPLSLRFSERDRGVPLAYWRSVGNSQNCFCLETMLDLAARAAGQDPLDYRRRLLAGGDRPARQRVLALLEALAERAGCARPLPPGHFRGLALSEANRAVAGHVVEIALAGPGRFRLVRITAALDVGWVGNPDAVSAQLMGGTVFGLGAALFGEIGFAEDRALQRNFDGYRLPRLAELPPIELLVLGEAERPGGAGEEAVPSIAPALANALLAASGRPVTRLPLTRAGWELAGGRG
ncbi:xanthine dehydrogenase family protein molybdopterin-binding subunit [Roseateles sp. DAIF2]|uniref:xanthine dehydrogenase family protein molybdopterin-binding subunit n=1 Tax=Roseateles sp. DAIF2 TaxID=2714952 RepID=UPI0018A26E26|nr:molybdopterin cofactor-binding domain-containing protein [Roseateles sp. DAIF2]QPF71967.1 xanthine dehydrogenase family protein molybdopterin-binding subunit [Roseateles sp. DAIF2]